MKRQGLLLCGLVAATTAGAQGNTTAQYYQYQRDQAFQKYMDNSSSKGSASQGASTSSFRISNQSAQEFADLITKRNRSASNSGRVWTAEETAAYNKQREEEAWARLQKIKAQNEKQRLEDEGWATIRRLVFNDGRVFEGHFVKENNWAETTRLLKGRMTYRGGDVYEGYFDSFYGVSRRNGFGTYTSKAGDVYVGYWYDDRRSGDGLLKKANGDIYQGDFHKDRPDGLGRMEYANGTVEEGCFTDGKFTDNHPPRSTFVEFVEVRREFRSGTKTIEKSGRKESGKGKIRWEGMKANYQGDFENYCVHGKGTMIFDNGIRYTGDFVYDWIHGKGKMEWPNGSIYEGDFVKTNRTGSGILKWKDGSVYVGEFLNNERHGNGKLTKADGTVKEGRWYKGQFVPSEPSFTSWKQALEKYKWDYLEVPENDASVHRYIKDDKLHFNHHSSVYSWSVTYLAGQRPMSYTFEAQYQTLKEGFKNGEVGIILMLNGADNVEPQQLYFIINPEAGKFWMGTYSPQTKTWTATTNPSADDGWLSSAAIKKFSADGSANNKLSLRKTETSLSIYCNDKLLFTQTITDATALLHLISGIGLVQSNDVKGSVSAINFSDKQ